MTVGGAGGCAGAEPPLLLPSERLNMLHPDPPPRPRGPPPSPRVPRPSNGPDRGGGSGEHPVEQAVARAERDHAPRRVRPSS